MKNYFCQKINNYFLLKVAFADVINKKIYLSNDNGKTVKRVDVPFRPDSIYLNEDESIIMVIENDSNKKNVKPILNRIFLLNLYYLYSILFF